MTATLPPEGEALRLELKAQKLNQEEFAEKMDFSRNYLLKLLNEPILKEEYKVKAAKLLGKKPNEIWGLQKQTKPAVKAKGGTPIYDIVATAGSNENVSQLPEVPSFNITIPGYEDCNFGMYVYGHSMYPTIESGSLILCRKVNDKQVIMYGEIYLIRTKDYLMTKRLQKANDPKHVLCTSDNFEQRAKEFKRFEPFDLDRDKIMDLYIVKGIIKKTQT